MLETREKLKVVFILETQPLTFPVFRFFFFHETREMLKVVPFDFTEIREMLKITKRNL